MPTGVKYSEQFHREAVELAKTTDKPQAEIAHEIGVTRATLRRWVRRAEVDAGQREGRTTEESEEVRQLRRDVRRLTQEREILKKAAVWFAKESETR